MRFALCVLFFHIEPDLPRHALNLPKSWEIEKSYATYARTSLNFILAGGRFRLVGTCGDIDKIAGLDKMVTESISGLRPGS